MEVILIANQKGGVGKTSTALAMANMLTALGYRVLSIDMNPQGDFTKATLKKSPEKTLYHAFHGQCELKDLIVPSNICDVVPANKTLGEVADSLVGKRGAEFSLFTMLTEPVNELENNYDFVLLDASNADDILTSACMIACDSVIIPMTPACFSLDGFRAFLQSHHTICKFYPNYKFDIDGILITNSSEEYASFRKQLLEIRELAEQVSICCYRTIIRRSGLIPKSQDNHCPLTDYAGPRSNGCSDYMNFTLEFLQKRGLAPKKEFPGVERDENGVFIYHYPTV